MSIDLRRGPVLQKFLEGGKEEVHHNAGENQGAGGKPPPLAQGVDGQGDPQGKQEGQGRRPRPLEAEEGEPHRDGNGRPKAGPGGDAQGVRAGQGVAGDGLHLKARKAQAAAYKDAGQSHGQANPPDDGPLASPGAGSFPQQGENLPKGEAGGAGAQV